jgi:hypothetical protein
MHSSSSAGANLNPFYMTQRQACGRLHDDLRLKDIFIPGFGGHMYLYLYFYKTRNSAPCRLLLSSSCERHCTFAHVAPPCPCCPSRPFLHGHGVNTTLQKLDGDSQMRVSSGCSKVSSGELRVSSMNSLHPVLALHCTALHCTALHCTALHWQREAAAVFLRPRSPTLSLVKRNISYTDTDPETINCNH